jgi:glycosyltransferase involved in cell wall biosynthesis
MIDVLIVTYNQEKTILQAVESVLRQKTSFPVRIIIGDDCSTDLTNTICEALANNFKNNIKIIKSNINLGLIANYKAVFNAVEAKYFAILEGDDYWIDDYKLQKQFDFLENNESYGLVHAGFNILTNGVISSYRPPSHSKLEGDILKDLIKSNFIGPLTICAKKEIVDKYIDFDFLIENGYKTIDYYLWIEFSINSKIGYLNEIVGVYRKESGSVSIPTDFSNYESFMNSIIKMLKHFEVKYSIDEKLIRDSINSINYDLFLKAIQYNNVVGIELYRNKVIPKGIIIYFKWLFAGNLKVLKVLKLVKLYK